MSEKKTVPVPAPQSTKTVINEPTTNNTSTTKAEVAPQPSITQTISEQSTPTTDVPKVNPVPSLASLFEDKKEDKSQANTEQLAKIMQADNVEEVKKVLEEIKQPMIKVATAGRMVVFHFDKNDGICINNVVTSLPATVVANDDLTTSLVVYTLDSRDPVVLRRNIPHQSITTKDSEGNAVAPFWTWPEIK